jgi:hypothetical protein
MARPGGEKIGISRREHVTRQDCGVAGTAPHQAAPRTDTFARRTLFRDSVSL